MKHKLLNIPDEMKLQEQWIVYKAVPRTLRNGKTKISKVPYSAITHLSNNWNSRENWVDFARAISVLQEGKYDGLAFVLTKEDQFVCIDLDNCIVDEKLNLNAKSIVETFLGTYMELSQSKKGIHIFLKGKLENNINNQSKGIEIYSHNRCIAMTGDIRTKFFKEEAELRNYDAELYQLYKNFMPKRTTTINSNTPTNSSLVPDVDTIIDTMCKFNKLASKLFNGLETSGDWSRDDFQLLLFLNSFTHGNSYLMQEIFLKSALNRLGDLSKRKSEEAYLKYLNISIQKAIQVGNNNYWQYQSFRHKGGTALE